MATVTYSWANLLFATPLNVRITGNQVDPAVGVLADDVFIAGWTNSSLSEVGFRTGSESGPAVAAESIQGSATQPSFSRLIDGRTLMSYTDFSSTANGDIRVNIGPTPIIVNSSTTKDTDSDVVALGDGGFVVTWTRDYGSGDNDIRGAVLNADGTIRAGGPANSSGLTISSTSSALSSSHSSVAAYAGGFVVTWQESASTGGNSSVYFRRYNSGGAPIDAAPVLIDADSSINQEIEAVGLQDGGFALVYRDNGWGTGASDISFKVFNADGSPRVNIRANTTATDVQYQPQLTVLENGFIVVAWNDAASGFIRYQAFRPNGEKIGPESFQFSNSLDFEIANIGSGDVAAVWSSATTDGDGTSIRGSVDTLIRATFGDGLDETLAGDALVDDMYGQKGSDALYGYGGNDYLRDGGSDALGVRDFLYGGVGNDTYVVWSTLTSAQDIVYEGPDLAGAQGGANDVDTIFTTGEFFRDFYSVAEIIRIDEDQNSPVAATYVVGGAYSNAQIIGDNGSNIISTYGGSKTVDARGGTDAISFSRYDLPISFEGVNTLLSRAGTGIDYLYDFQSGVDKVDLRPFNFGITGQQVLAQGVNVFGSDPNSSADDYVYFYLTNAGGVDNYVAFVGLTTAQLQANDFITA